jgi:tol-pal system protein YbgF
LRSTQERNRDALSDEALRRREETVDSAPAPPAPETEPRREETPATASTAVETTDRQRRDAGATAASPIEFLEPLAPAATSTPDRSSALPPAVGSPADAAGEALYREAYALYYRRDHQGAEERWRQFIARCPESDLADDAQYWIGECRFARGLFREARGEFRTVVDRYPSGNRVPHAHYGIALCQQRLGEEASMRETLALLLREFPRSDVAPLARARLETP